MFRVFLLVNLVLWCFVCLTGEVSYMYVQTNYINPPIEELLSRTHAV